jgi:hypothetical protein
VGWLIATIVLIALIWFMIVSPGFRYFIVAIVVLGGLAIYGWNESEQKDYERRQQEAAQDRAAHERAALSAISRSDLALEKVQLKKGSSSWTLTGNVTNNSKHHLGSLEFKVLIEDNCPLPETNKDWAVDLVPKKCITIGQDIARARVSVPPGQMRAFSSGPISFEGMPETNSPRWRYKIT